MSALSHIHLQDIFGNQRVSRVASKLLLTVSIAAATASMAAEPLTAPKAALTLVSVEGTAPMVATPIDLSAYGYTEQEYYVEGVANRYRGAQRGALQTAEIIDSGWPYKSRVLVRKPTKEKFNGTLIVEWANVTLGQDVDFAFAESYEYLLDEGYAVAVVSAQKVGVDRLKNWSPARYGMLSVDADNTDPLTGEMIDQCIDVRNCVADPLSWDILTQVTEALKAPNEASHPLYGLDVERTLALAESQSAVRLSTYYNSIQPLYGAFDGFVFLDLALQLRDDLTSPAISVNSEVTKELKGLGVPVPSTSEYTRIWDVVGASHASKYAIQYVDDIVVRDGSFPGPQGPMAFSELTKMAECDLVPNYGIADIGLVLNKAIDSVNGWVATGVAASPTLTMHVDAEGKIMRDEMGRANGGVRLPSFEVPTEVFSQNGPNTILGCFLSAHHDELTAEELKARYGTHDAYVERVKHSAERLVTAGYLLPEDQSRVIEAAQASNVAR